MSLYTQVPDTANVTRIASSPGLPFFSFHSGKAWEQGYHTHSHGHTCILTHTLLHYRFSVFADLFSEAVKRGLRGLQSQNPGIYYHQAALYALERKQLGNKLGLEAARNTSQLLPSLPATTYYGQRPWRVGLTDSMPSNMELRQKCILKMQALEFGVDNSVSLLLS